MKNLRKAAVIVASLGTELATEVCNKLDETTVRSIANELAHLDAVNSAERHEILKEFQATCHEIEPVAGLNMAQQLLINTLGKERSGDLLFIQNDGLDHLRQIAEMDPPVIARRLEIELPQTTAVIINQLTATKAAAVLQNMPEEARIDIISRIATMRSLAPGTLQAVAAGLGETFAPSTETKQSTQDSSVPFMVEILSNLDRQTEEKLLSQLHECDSKLAEQIKESLFTFEDMLNLPDRALQTVLRAAESQTLAMALKGLDEKSTTRITDNLSERAREAIKEEMEALGPVRVSDVDKARSQLATEARNLEESGEISIDHGDVEYIE